MNHQQFYQRHGCVAFIHFEQGRVNSLSLRLRQYLAQALTEALADDAVKAIALMGKGGLFSAGADVTEFNTPAATTEPTLRDVIALIQRSNKPVLAAIDGVAYGGGLELALACWQRLLGAHAKLALPEVSLGLVPGAGGTQRLPRLVGFAHALELVSTGRSLNATEAVHIGLGVAAETADFGAEACALAERLAADFRSATLNLPPLSLGDAEATQLQQAYAKMAKTKRGFKAPKVAIDCVAASTSMSLPDGLVYERQQFETLLQGKETQALRHLFFAQRQATKTSPSITPVPIHKIAVVGGGLMGTGISMSCADAGIPVWLLEQTEAALTAAQGRIARYYQGMVAKGRLSQAEAMARAALIKGTLRPQDLAEVDLVIEAVFEDMALKQALCVQLDSICRADAIIASNTSRLDINQLAEVTVRPERVLGMHFFSPANVMRLLEVVRAAKTAPEVVASVIALAKRLGKIAVVVGVCEGFVGNRMLSVYQREALFLLEEGASVEQVDGALFDFGMAMGPFVMSDMAGLDIGWAARKRLAATRDSAQRYSQIADKLCELGRFGQKTQAGYYRYQENSRTPLPDPMVAKVITDCARAAGITPTPITAALIIERTLYALINEGANILEEGIAATAGDIDLVYVHGYGFPAYCGGPLFYADAIGLDVVLSKMKVFHAEYGAHWQPAPLIERLVASGQGFYGPLKA